MRVSAFALLCFIGGICSSLVPVPGVGYRPEECVHRVPSGSHLSKEKDGTVTVITPEQVTYSLPVCDLSNGLVEARQDSGWIAYANFLGNFTTFNGTWTVPKNPTKYDNQILYFFPGLVDSGDSEIIQPVLQYGPAPDGGGKYWAVACWWVTNTDQYVVSSEVKVSPGDSIFGYMNTMANTSWLIGAEINGKKSQSTSLIMSNLAPQTFASVTLEAYDVTACNNYPSDGSITFTNLAMKFEGKSVTPTWTPNIDFSDCNQNVQSSNPTTVTISY